MDDVIEVDIIGLFRKNALLLVLATVLVGALAFGGSYLMPNEYTASTSMYVLVRNEENTTASITQTELSSAQMVATDVVTIMTSDRVKNDVAGEMGLENLNGYKLNITNSTNTRMITLSVTGKDPELTAKVANAIVKDTSDVAIEVMDIKSVNVIDEATAPTAPSGPRHLMIGAVGAAAGFALAFAIAFMRDALDTRVRSGEDASNLIGVPVVGHFSKLEA
ncbi:MAG: Wzz/FepE/Etk N-terminal domain-containing protein [Atopobiaceae bacterium]|jgi:capsular polysaccharide biosynthesis protein|nr:Wzz/FepE/Etk N-terminal domain-containing protein [Atopobiaceae bacterium]